MLRLRISRIAFALFICLPCVLRAKLSDKQRKFYNELRKRFFVAIAMPPTPGRKYRKEHLTYLRAATSFMKEVGKENVQYQAGAMYFRGRVLLHAGNSKMAAKDFAACVEMLADRKGEDALPPGLTSIATVHVFNAMSLAGKGDETMLEALEAIPEGLPMPSYNDVGGRILKWAETLEGKQELDLAIRAYKQIDRFGLWEEDFENPRRRIKLLEYAQKGGKTELPPIATGAVAADGGAKPATKPVKKGDMDDDWF